MKTLHARVHDLTAIMKTAGGSLTHLACMEADAIAALILAGGDEETATSVIVDHIAPDEFGDFGCADDDSPHSSMYPLAEHTRAESVTDKLHNMATAYVRTL